VSARPGAARCARAVLAVHVHTRRAVHLTPYHRAHTLLNITVRATSLMRRVMRRFVRDYMITSSSASPRPAASRSAEDARKTRSGARFISPLYSL
jgi:hypothetical protein